MRVLALVFILFILFLIVRGQGFKARYKYNHKQSGLEDLVTKEYKGKDVIIDDRAVMRSSEEIHRPENRGAKKVIYMNLMAGYKNLIQYPQELRGLPRDVGGRLNNMIDNITQDVQDNYEGGPLNMMAEDLAVQQAIWNSRGLKKRPKKHRAEKVLVAGVKHTNDAQNVHDTGVIDGLKDIYMRLKSSAPKKASLRAIKEYIDGKSQAGDLTDRHKNLAKKAVDYINDHDTGIHSYGGEDQKSILASCWGRADANPVDKQDTIKSNIILALADCYENGKDIVCPVGRANKILGALCLADMEYGDQKVATEEDLRNEIMTLCHQEFRTVLGEEAPGGELSDAAKSFDDPKIKPTEEAEARLNAKIKGRLETVVDERGGKLRPAQKDRLKKEILFIFE